MEEPKSLDSLFDKKIFRIPDYQRGYAWQEDQLRDFWEDLINLSGERSHYTGVITLKEVNSEEISNSANEYWLVEDHSYKMYQVVDGQQRLTTIIVFLQAFIELVKEKKVNTNKSYQNTDSLKLEEITEQYLYKKPTGGNYRTYKFGYTKDNPSYKYLKYEIFSDPESHSIKETFYTLNLRNAKDYFYKQLEELYNKSRIEGLNEIYEKLTKQFLFNEYVIKDEFNVFVAFETMNNRGKRLSDLELLKNRLIYLTTLYTDEELDAAGRKNLRDAINDAWKEVYHQLGRNDKHPLNDDDFLKAHWIMYFQYSRKKGHDYIKFLLDEQFSPQKIHKKIECEVALEMSEEQPTDFAMDDTYIGNITPNDEPSSKEVNSAIMKTMAELKPTDIKEYVNSLKASAVHWFNSYYPDLATELTDDEKDALNRLNRIGMGYFRPLIMSVFKNEKSAEKRINLLDKIERFIFIVIRLSQARSNYRDSEFYNAAREFNQDELTLEKIEEKLDKNMSHYFHKDGKFNSNYFRDYLYKKFNSGDKSGYYGWRGLRYFLYEYEQKLLGESRQKKVAWEDLLKTKKDKISIEHIFPQTTKEDKEDKEDKKNKDTWKKLFEDVDKENYPRYRNSIGNLLLLSMSINSSLQNNNFADKKKPKYKNDKKIRNGYSDGSHSEIEVANWGEKGWTPEYIEGRGLKLLGFMEERWGIKFKDEKTKKELLFLVAENEDGSDQRELKYDEGESKHGL